MKSPCKDCPERHELCWSQCEKYLDFRAKRDACNKARRDETQIASTHDQMLRSWVNRRRGRT